MGKTYKDNSYNRRDENARLRQSKKNKRPMKFIGNVNLSVDDLNKEYDDDEPVESYDDES